MEDNDKTNEYAAKIMVQIQEMFDEDCDNHIDPEELTDNNNATDFVHALATIAPAMIVSRLTGQQYDALGFNHMANRLCAQKSTFVDD